MKESSYLRLALKQIEQRQEWGPREEWASYHFRQLSEQIEAKSQVKLSSRTLKNLFEERFSENYNPQYPTKNALALFLDYANWQALKEALTQEAATPTSPASQEAPLSPLVAPRTEASLPASPLLHPNPTSLRPRWLKRGLPAGTLLALVAIAYFWYTQRPAPPVSFESLNPVGDAPHVAFFRYDISGLNANTVFVENEEYLDETKQRYFLTQDSGTLHFLYPRPYFFQVHLIGDRRTAASANVHVTTQDWAVLVSNIYHAGLDPYQQAGQLYVPRRQTQSLNTRPDTAYFLEYRYFHPGIEIDGDNLSFEMRSLCSPEVGGQSCFDSGFELTGSKGRHYIRFVEKGCSEFARVIVGEKSYFGGLVDLSPLSVDLSRWRHIRLEVHDRQAIFWLDDRPVFRTAYDSSIGTLKGICLKFKGGGAVDFVRLKNNAGEVVYESEFDQPHEQQDDDRSNSE